MNRKQTLSKKTHWDLVHKNNTKIANCISNRKIFESYYHFALFRLINKYTKSHYKKAIEIGCAPGNYLVKFKNYFNLDMFGIEYSEGGRKKTVLNVAKHDIPAENIILGDFFDDDFLNKNREKYDVVFSTGFIEHFSDSCDVIKKQFSLVKKEGMLICLIPNAGYLNKFLSSKKILNIHNLSIMNRDKFKEIFMNNALEIKYCDYFGGLINFGIFGNKKNASKLIFAFLFFIQRLFIDSIQKLLFLLTGKDLTIKYTSPSLLCIARKK